MPEANIPDSELWHSFKKKDPAAFDEIFRLHYAGMFLYGYKITQDKSLLEDAIQELFIELWTSRSVSEVRSVKAYLLRSLQFKLFKKIREQRSTKSEPYLPYDYHFEVSNETLLTEQEESDENTNRILHYLSQLSNRQKEAIYLRFYRNMNHEEISEVMGINYQASRNLLSQSLKALRGLMTSTSVGCLIMLTGFIFCS